MKYKFGCCFNDKWAINYSGPILYDNVIHYSLTILFITIGWWRDATDLDYDT